jgi:hypothetical protein
MKKIMVMLIIGVFMTSFALAAETDSSQNDNQYQSGQENENGIQNQEENQITDSNQNRGVLSQSQIGAIIRERNRLRIHANSSECPNNCTCQGSTTRCQLNGNREMEIEAGESGNTIIQVKGIRAQTQIQLYKSDGKLYGVFNDNETKRILSPEQIQERIRERLMIENCTCENMQLNENGEYEFQTQKRARLFALFPVNERLRLQINAENGEIIRTRAPWWGFLASDIKEEQLMGSNCGTVTPGQNDACCQNRGYDAYDSEAGECIFLEE